MPFTYASSVVLPLMGFWNSVIYITTSWTACKFLFSQMKNSIMRRQLLDPNSARGRTLTTSMSHHHLPLNTRKNEASVSVSDGGRTPAEENE